MFIFSVSFILDKIYIKIRRNINTLMVSLIAYIIYNYKKITSCNVISVFIVFIISRRKTLFVFIINNIIN